jgi:hypothetical protein
MSSSEYVKKAIEKYGINKFKKKIISIHKTRESAIAKEIKMHKRFNVSNHPLFFNRCNAEHFGISVGALYTKGKTYEEIHGEEKARILRARRSSDGKRYSKKRDYSGEKNPNYGNTWSEEQRKLLSEKLSGDNSKIRGSFWVTDGAKNIKIPKDSNIPKGFKKGRTLDSKWLPPKHTGMSWYNNGVKNIKLKPNDSIPDGFKKGRLIKK